MTEEKKTGKALGRAELIAIALGGMIGGGIFTILGVSVSLVGNLTPVAIIAGGVLALLAAYSYVKLALYFKDEGASYAFIRRTYPASPFSASAIGWYVTFGYISTLALYSYTFSSYVLSSTGFAHVEWARKAAAIAVIFLFGGINIWSVKGMGKIEDLMVYTKLLLLALVSFVLIKSGNRSFAVFAEDLAKDAEHAGMLPLLMVASLTFVAYEGFQLVINAQNVMTDPARNIPFAIYTAIGLVVCIYVVISVGALFAIPAKEIIENKEFALASGAGKSLGRAGFALVVLSAVLATTSAISGTIFGSSRQMAAIATDGFFPLYLSRRHRGIPVIAIFTMCTVASLLIAIGGLELILEFGSFTFLFVSLLMAIANFRLRKSTNSNTFLAICAMAGLTGGALLILYYEMVSQPFKLAFMLLLYVLLTVVAWIFSAIKKRKSVGSNSD